MAGEHEFLRRLADRLPTPPEGQTWVGDDAAVLGNGPAGTPLLLATDTLVEGVHARLDWASPADIGWKALAVNVSDLAAMGGRPRCCVVAATLPRGPGGVGDRLVDGLADAADVLECPLVGGDTTSGPTLVVTVTVLGDAPASGAVLRSGARPGDHVLVSGPLGQASRALSDLEEGRRPREGDRARLHRPAPRVAAGRAAAGAGATAMIDVSDGLTADLDHVCRASGVGAQLVLAAVPRVDGVTEDQALGGGDDYELCWTTPDARAARGAFAAAGLDPPTVIGRIEAEAGLRAVDAEGRIRGLEPTGWDHPMG